MRPSGPRTPEHGRVHRPLEIGHRPRLAGDRVRRLVGRVGTQGHTRRRRVHLRCAPSRYAAREAAFDEGEHLQVRAREADVTCGEDQMVLQREVLDGDKRDVWQGEGSWLVT